MWARWARDDAVSAAKLIKKVLESGEEILPDEARRGKVVYLLFQPAEEGGAGAKKMLESKTMRDMKIRPSTAFALHNWRAETPSGSFGARGGTIMAGAGTFEITVTGRGDTPPCRIKMSTRLFAGRTL